MKRSELSKEQLECKQILESFFITWERLVSFWEKALKKNFWINVRYFMLLDYLEEHSSALMWEMKDLLYTSYQSFSQIIRQMEKDWVIKREREWRNIRVSLTQKWLDFVSKIRDGMSMKFLPEMMEVYKPEERKTVLNHMHKFQKNFLDKVEPKLNDK